MNFAAFDLNLLRVLDALFRAGSTVKAGERLGLSQSAVSGALSRLRFALDDELFIRSGNRLVPTKYAEYLRDPLRLELERIEGLLAAPAAFDPALAVGHFKISGSDFFAELLMPALGNLLNKTAPKISAQLVDLYPRNYVDSLDNYDADLALIPDTATPNWLSRQILFRSPFVVIARRSNPAVQEFAEHHAIPMDAFCKMSHVLFSPEGKRLAMGDAALARVGRSRHVAMTVPVFSGVCRVVSESDLIALVPAQLAEKLAPSLDLRIFQPPMHIEPALIIGIWHKRSDKEPMSMWMRQQVFELLELLEMGAEMPEPV